VRSGGFAGGEGLLAGGGVRNGEKQWGEKADQQKTHDAVLHEDAVGANGNR